jgi:catechol 2,3-dioxygenase-like lactoylglutathione lyase family enzyme
MTAAVADDVRVGRPTDIHASEDRHRVVPSLPSCRRVGGLLALGGEHRWLTVVSREARDGVELALERDEHPAARPFKAALVEDGIPYTSFAVDDVAAEHTRLVGLGVRFTQPPTPMGEVTTAVFDDTSGNLIQIAELTG